MSIPPTTQKTNQGISDALLSFFWGSWGKTDCRPLGSFWRFVGHLCNLLLCCFFLSLWRVSSCSSGVNWLHAHLSPHSRWRNKDVSHIRFQWTLAKYTPYKLDCLHLHWPYFYIGLHPQLQRQSRNFGEQDLKRSWKQHTCRIHFNGLNANDQIQTEHTSIWKQKPVEAKVFIHNKYTEIPYFKSNKKHH